MALYVVAYPKLTESDYTWLQMLREQHDPNFAKITPHFTLVFALQNIESAKIIAHVEKIALDWAAFRFSLRCAMPVKDVISSQTHLFLVPDEGFSNLVRLHDRLYSNILANQLRLDIPFVPHLTGGNFSDPAACKQVCDELNAQAFEINGYIDSVDVIKSNLTTGTIAKFFLK
jgi:2'-5' RNA ligase